MPSKSDLMFYGKVLLAVAGAAFVLSRVVPGIGMRVGLRPDPLSFIPSIPILNPSMRRVNAQASAQPVSARDELLAGMA